MLGLLHLIGKYLQNEELLHKTVDTLQEGAVIHQQRYDILKDHATQKLEKCVQFFFVTFDLIKKVCLIRWIFKSNIEAFFFFPLLQGSSGGGERAFGQ